MKISIITICRNAETTIEQAIQSVINQNYDDFEYIIIDGDSSDSTKDIIEKYREHIHIFISEKDQGISDAFNKGIRQATGDVIGILNADDVMLQGTLSIVAKEMKEKTDVLFGHVKSFIEVDKIPPSKYISDQKEVNLSALRYEMCISHPATFIRRAAYEKYGLYDLSYKNSMDRELLLRMYVGNAVFQHTPYLFTLFRAGGVTDKAFRRSIEESYSISVKYGGLKWKAWLIKIKKIIYSKLCMRKTG